MILTLLSQSHLSPCPASTWLHLDTSDMGLLKRLWGNGYGQTSYHFSSLLLSLSPLPAADINECNSLSEPCSSGFNCVNTVGSYTCQQKIIKCSHGYHASPGGAKCVGENRLFNATARAHGAGKRGERSDIIPLLTSTQEPEYRPSTGGSGPEQTSVGLQGPVILG